MHLMCNGESYLMHVNDYTLVYKYDQKYIYIVYDFLWIYFNWKLPLCVTIDHTYFYWEKFHSNGTRYTFIVQN